MMTSSTTFIAGLIAMGFTLAGLFFLKFWRRTRDVLFAAFAVAFWLMALNQGLVWMFGIRREEQSWIFLLRLAAFTLIIAAILYKNLGREGRPRRTPSARGPWNEAEPKGPR